MRTRLVQLAGWLNPALWTLLIVVFLVLIPLIIVNQWDELVQAVRESPKLKRLVLYGGIVAGVIPAFGLLLGILRSLYTLLRRVNFRTVLWGAITAAMLWWCLPFLIGFVGGWQFPLPERWGVGVFVLYLFFVGWVLKKL